MYVQLSTSEFDSLIFSLIRRMLYLKKIESSFHLSRGTSFIDCTYLENSFLNQILYLERFIFDNVIDHIRHTFIQRGYYIDGYISYTNYLNRKWNQCYFYSIPYLVEYLQTISHSFTGSLFNNVRILWMRDEYSLFMKISHSFPLLRQLAISN